MASYQRVALFILFDAIETDLIGHIRQAAGNQPGLTSEELDKARARLLRKIDLALNPGDAYDLIYGLDLAEKYQVLMRNKVSKRPSVRSKKWKGCLPGFTMISSRSLSMPRLTPTS